MKCSVWKSSSKEFTYVYLTEGQNFDDLPIALRKAFGEPERVMDLDLNPGRKLAYEDIEQVRHNLVEQGYHLQLPPSDDPTGLLELPEKKDTLL